ncbi:MAG: prepilin-type N-terminal cleavage/methylation domain-containing protein [Candidatus Omnitrophica bacterium]|nr:prepilin-type N-terminal cleavage/methylation domain-containing protein [Candidatus Omnitrophota bacterium]
MNAITNKGFTYIELLITLVIMAVLFVPMMQVFSHFLHSTVVSQDFITATNLARWEMERVKNLNMTKAQLREAGDSIYPSGEPLEMNNAKWRISRKVFKETDPLEVRVSVFHDGEPDRPLVTLVTLIEDTIWEEIRPLE